MKELDYNNIRSNVMNWLADQEMIGNFQFWKRLEENAGIRVTIENTDNMVLRTCIVDEKKYILFLLKYGTK